MCVCAFYVYPCLPACLSVYCVTPGTREADSGEPPCMGASPGPLQEQQVLMPTCYLLEVCLCDNQIWANWSYEDAQAHSSERKTDPHRNVVTAEKNESSYI